MIEHSVSISYCNFLFNLSFIRYFSLAASGYVGYQIKGFDKYFSKMIEDNDIALTLGQ